MSAEYETQHVIGEDGVKRTIRVRIKGRAKASAPPAPKSPEPPKADPAK